MLEPLNLPALHIWDLLGHPRHWSIRENVWDKFGFLIEEDTPIFLNAFTGGDLVRVRVDYPHGHRPGARTRVQVMSFDGVDDDVVDDTAYLCDVCTARAVKHFAYQWLRYTQRKSMGRLLAYSSLLPDSVLARIFSYAV